MIPQQYKSFSEAEHRTWKILFDNLEHCRQHQAASIFARGISALGINGERIPDLEEVNSKLSRLTGWRGVAVTGLEDNPSFFRGMAERQFPIGNFIRDSRDVNYTPAPDVFHDLYGHLPFFADGDYADFCAEFGKRAAKHTDSTRAMDLWGRLFWFGVEFPLLETPKGPRIFGGGILSSVGECNYSLSPEPQVKPFDVKDIVDRSYKIDEFQKTIFLLRSPQQLYGCLDDFERLVAQRL